MQLKITYVVIDFVYHKLMIDSPQSSSAASAGADPRQGVESIETGGRLLHVLAGAAGPMMLRDLAAAAGMAPAKAHRYLVSLTRLGLVEQQAGNGRYDIGPFAIQLGLAGLGRLDPLRVATEELEHLRDQLGHTVALAVAGNHGPTIVRWLDSGAPVSAALRTGAVMPLTRSATGRAFLAFAPAGSFDSLLNQELVDNRQRGLQPSDRPAVQIIIDEARAHGLGRVQGELSEAVHSVSVPVFDAEGRLQLAVTALGYRGSFDADWEGEPAQRIKACARAIGQRLGVAADGWARPGSDVVDRDIHS